MRCLAFAMLAVLLTACASGAKPEAMAPTAGVMPVAATQPGAGSVFVGTVTGGQKTNPLWTSEIDNEAFAAALTEGLRARGFLAPTADANRIRVDATLVKVKQPAIGFTYTVTTTVHYKVTTVATSAVLLDEDIVADGKATTGDAFAGYVRLRLANEASGRANVEAFISRLIDVLKPAAPPTS